MSLESTKMADFDTTVAIITRNRASLLKRTLQSIAMQTHPPDEVLVIDNASTDNTGQIANEMARFLPIRYIYESRVGICFARNTALSNCKSGILAFIDDDAVADKDWLKRLVETFENSPEAVAVQGRTENIYPENIIANLFQYTCQDMPKQRDREGCVVKSPSMVCTMNFSFRVDPIKKAGICFDTSLARGEDRHFGHQMMRNNLLILYAENAANYHHWPKTAGDYLRSRWKSGIAKARLKKKLGNACYKKETGRGNISTLKTAFDKVDGFPYSQRFLFMLLLFAGKIISGLGQIHASLTYTDSPR